MVDLGAERRGRAGRPGRGAVGAVEAGRVAQAGVEDAAERRVVLGGVEVPGEDGRGVRAGGGRVAQPAQLPLPQADLLGQRRHGMGELEPYGVAVDVGERAGHAHGAGDAVGGPERVAAEDDGALGAAALHGLPVRMGGRQLPLQGRVAGVLALLDEHQVRLLAAHGVGQRAGGLPELHVGGQHPQLGDGRPGGVAGLPVRLDVPGQQAEQDDAPHGAGPPAGEQGEQQTGGGGHEQPGQEGEQLGHRGDAVGVGGAAADDRAHPGEQQCRAPGAEPSPSPGPPSSRVVGDGRVGSRSVQRSGPPLAGAMPESSLMDGEAWRAVAGNGRPGRSPVTGRRAGVRGGRSARRPGPPSVPARAAARRRCAGWR